MPRVEADYNDSCDMRGIRLRINSDANLQDLLDAWQPLCDHTAFTKQYASNSDQSCRACTHNCCDTAYVIPDLIALKKMAAYLGISPKELADTYFQPEKRAIGLLRMLPNPCVFLKDRLCSIYPVRSLICRFYLCAALEGSTEELIYHISSTGMAATHVFARETGILQSPAGAVSSMDRLFLELFDRYAADPGLEHFLRARDYCDIPLKPFLDSAGFISK